MAQLQQFLPILLIIGVFYFLIIRPQQKRATAQREMLASIKSGDEIVTVGGIYAVIIEVGERIRVRVADGSELELAKQAIAQVVAPKGAAAAEAADDVEDADDGTVEADLEEDAQPAMESESPEC